MCQLSTKGSFSWGLGTSTLAEGVGVLTEIRIEAVLILINLGVEAGVTFSSFMQAKGGPKLASDGRVCVMIYLNGILTTDLRILFNFYSKSEHNNHDFINLRMHLLQ